MELANTAAQKKVTVYVLRVREAAKALQESLNVPLVRVPASASGVK